VPDVGRGQHTAEFELEARSDVAHEETYKNATGVAAVGLRFLAEDAYANEVSGDAYDSQGRRRFAERLDDHTLAK
jgi:hypothetical protein